MTLTLPHRAALLSLIARELFNLEATPLPFSLPTVELADQEKVAPQVLELYRTRGQESPALHADAQRISHKRGILAEELALVATRLKEEGLLFVAMRGFAIQSHYPEGQLRQFNDLDLVLPDSDQFGRALAVLKDLGYFVARPMTARRTESGAWVGASLNRLREDLDHPVYLDLLAEGPGLSMFAHHRLPDVAWGRLETMLVGGVEVPALAATDALVAFAVELQEREWVTARDVIDACLLATKADCAEAMEAIGRLGLSAQVERLLELADSAGLAAPDGLRQGAVSSLRSPGASVHSGWYTRLHRAASWVEDRHTGAGCWVARVSARHLYRSGRPIFLIPSAASVRGSRSHSEPGLFSGMVLRGRPFLSSKEFGDAFPEVAVR